MDAQSSELFNGDCIGGRISHVTMIMDLPRMIMIEIISRLPIKSIFCCKTVCKLWCNLLSSDPLFVEMYQTRSPNFPCILLLDGHYNPWLLELKADYDYDVHPCNKPIQLTPKFHFPPVSDVILVRSCNGIICLVNGKMHTEKHSVYICNPLLGEYFELKLPKWEISVCQVAYGFCFSEASGEYKVLRLVIREVQDNIKVTELEVYTLGVDEKWRNVGEILCPTWFDFGEVNINGALHWMAFEENDSIFSFDIETEKIKSLPAPPGLNTIPPNLMLAELGNYLCLTDIETENIMLSGNINIWWMKVYGVAESWTKDSILANSIPHGMDQGFSHPIFIWKDGEILIRSSKKLASYNPGTKMFRRVNVNCDVNKTSRYNPSFYSLKTIMGDNFQVNKCFS